MKPLDLLLAADATLTGRAQPRRSFRHVHVAAEPLAVAAVQMAGEPFSLWGALVGTTSTQPRLIVAPEPRARDVSYAALSRFGEIICNEIAAASNAPRVEYTNDKGVPYSRCTRAPQLLVANPAVVGLLRRLGRRMRTAGYQEATPAPPFVNAAGAHLSFYADSDYHPGSALLLVASRELARHRRTGQSSLEDAHLGTQLAWWNPAFVEEILPGALGARATATVHGADAALLVERAPMGVLTDPSLDNDSLLEAVSRFNEARRTATDASATASIGAEIERLLYASLLPTWRALWVAHRELLAIPEAHSVPRRWGDDLQRFTRHADYVAKGGRLAFVDSALRAARALDDRERALSRLTAEEVLDDPLGMAGALAAGEALRGVVVDVDLDHKEIIPGGRKKVSRPLLTLAPEDAYPIPRETVLWLAARPVKVCAEVQRLSTGQDSATTVVLKITKGMTTPLPKLGDKATFSIYTDGYSMAAPLPKDLPWTHRSTVDAASDNAGKPDALKQFLSASRDAATVESER